MEYPKFDPKDPFSGLFENLAEILKDPDYKPHFIELLKAKTRYIETQTLEKLEKIHRPRLSKSSSSLQS